VETHARPDTRTVEDGLLKIRILPERESCELKLSGELDLSNVPSLDHELRRAVSLPLSTVIVDLSGLAFIDSLGIACLVKAVRHSNGGPELRMRRPSAEVARVFELTGVGEILPYAD
jgi:anti-sigma B factor antagonist